MSVIYLLISISIVVAVGFLYAFLRAVKTGQYDDDYTPSVRMLFDDELVKNIPKTEILNSKTEKIKTRIKTKTI
jgi:cbb3-type cytochrome oxidase maturation protein